jgi:DNA-binding response OmpR family regulator
VLYLLCADDDPDMRAILEAALRLDPEIEPEIFPSGSALLERARFGDAHGILLDAMMPAPDGLAAGAIACLPKPFDPRTLAAELRRAIIR